jgi:hypothetical protein
MWNTLITTAIAGAIMANVVHLASKINNIQAARQRAVIEATLQRDASVLSEMQRPSRPDVQQKTNVEPGA